MHVVRIILFAGLLAVLPGWSARADQLDDAARQLGDPNPDVRDNAAKTLRSAGTSAEKALRAIVDSGEPEAARRARALLREIRQPEPEEPPLPPDAPEIVAYRNADRDNKTQRIAQGSFRPNVLVQMWAEEEDANLRAEIFRAMVQSPAAYATALVAGGRAPAAEGLLNAALAESNPEAIVPYATLAMLRGQLNDAINRWSHAKPEAEGGEAFAAAVLARLYRTAGDPARAIEAARRSGDAGLVEEMLVSSGDWRGLAQELQAQPAPPQVGRPKQLGKLAGAYYLAGDTKAFDDLLVRMQKAANPATLGDVARTLMLAGRVDEGMRLGELNDPTDRMKLLASQERWDDLLALLASQDKAKTDAAMRVRILAAEQLYFLGEEKQAAELLDRVATENQPAKNLGIEVLLGSAYRRIGQADRAWEHFRIAVRAETNANAGVGEGPRAAWIAFYVDDDADGDADVGGSNLWEILREKYRDDSLDECFDRARKIVEGKTPIDELTDLADITVRPVEPRRNRGGEASRRYRIYASNLIRFVGQRVKSAGRDADAEKFLLKAAEAAPQSEFALNLYLRLGDWSVDAKDWSKAAYWYGRAWNADRSRAGPLYLRAWALGKAGWHARASELMNLAYTLPLGDGMRRYESIRMLQDRRQYDAVARETAVILRTSRYDQYAGHIAMQLSADQADREGDAATAVMWRERMTFNLMGVFDLSDPVGYLRIPHSLHRGRAKAALAKGDVETAQREVGVCQSILPGEILLAIDIVPEFERVGDKARADAVYTDALKTQEAVIAKHPGAANHHNDAAWLAVNCGRDLDGALAHATKAVELRPKNTAYIDTLAEVQFRRGDIDGAIKTMQRCVELEPHQLRHHEQLDRFEAARHGEKRPIPPA